MSEVLSQEEIDALLKGVSEGEVDTETKGGESVSAEGIISYDLTSQEKIVRGRMPTLEMVAQRFARVFRSSLSSMLRKLVDVSLLSNDTIKYGNFLKSLSIPASIHIFKMDPLKGYSLVVLDSKLVYTLVDVFFGGRGDAKKDEGREFTTIEDRIVKRVMEAVLEDLEEAWAPVHKLKFKYVRSEMNPQFVTIVPPSDIVIVTIFEVEIAKTVGTLTVCIPYSNIEPIRSKLYRGFQTDRMEVDINWIKRLKKLISSLYLEVKVLLGERELTIEEILNLKEGDVIPFNKDVDEPLIAEIEGIPKFKVVPGILKSNKAVKIFEKIEDKEY
jgi:flagellar motor switch protein FliM